MGLLNETLWPSAVSLLPSCELSLSLSLMFNESFNVMYLVLILMADGFSFNILLECSIKR